jgi:hypothetical protein
LKFLCWSLEPNALAASWFPRTAISDSISGIKLGQDARKSNLRRQIDENLQRVYQEALEEDIPERFAELLQRLAEQERAGHDKRDA